MAGDVTAVLEIGTCQVRCLVGEVRRSKYFCIGYGEVDSPVFAKVRY